MPEDGRELAVLRLLKSAQGSWVTLEVRLTPEDRAVTGLVRRNGPPYRAFRLIRPDQMPPPSGE